MNNNPTYQQPLCTSCATSVESNTETTRQRDGNETITTANDTVRLVPERRFPGYWDNWEIKGLYEVCDSIIVGFPFKGQDITDDESGHPILRAYSIGEGRILHGKDYDKFYPYDSKHLERYQVHTNDIVIAMDGSVGKNISLISENEDKYLLIQRVARLRIKEYPIQLIYQQIISQRFKDFAKAEKVGAVIAHISQKQIESFPIFIPTSSVEQQKIADCLQSIDEYIAATNQKLEQLKIHKKALLQKLFPQRGKNIPEFRFPEFQNAEPWKEKTLGEVFKRIKDKNRKNNKNVLTISAQYGLISQYDFFHKNVAATDVSNYYLIKKNDFAYNKSRSQGYPYGAIKSLKLYEDGVVSPLYICFRLKNNDYNNDFFEQYFKTELINYEIGKMAQEGARHHGLLNISTKEFFNNVLLFVPSPSEQNKIAACLRSIDEDITSTTQKIEQLKNHKNALLQQLFVNKQSYNMPN